MPKKKSSWGLPWGFNSWLIKIVMCQIEWVYREMAKVVQFPLDKMIKPRKSGDPTLPGWMEMALRDKLTVAG